MPLLILGNVDGFVVDDRDEVEYAQWHAEPCMANCKATAATITRKSTDVGVTPADDGSMAESFMEQQLAALGGVEWGKERVAGSVHMGEGGVAEDEPVAQVANAEAPVAIKDADAPDPALMAAGEKAFRRCKSCHSVCEGARNKTGPHLNGVLGRTIGGLDGFRYSNAFQSAADAGQVWDNESLAAFLANPKAYLQGTKMSFAGLKSEADIEAVTEYLRSFGG